MSRTLIEVLVERSCEEFPGSLEAEDPVLSLLWIRSLLWPRFNPWQRNFCMLQAWPKNGLAKLNVVTTDLMENKIILFVLQQLIAPRNRAS